MKTKFPNVLIGILLILVTLLNACASQAETSTPAPAPAVVEDAPVVFAVTASATATAAPPEPSALSALLSEIIGRVETKQANQEKFTPAGTSSFLDENGQAMTGSDGRVRLDLSTGTIVRLAPDSLFTLVSNEPADGSLKTRIQLAIGSLFVILNGGSLEVETPTGTAAVRGSFMSVSFNPYDGQVRITCLEGHCSLKSSGGSVEITAGQTAVITGAGLPPQVGEMIDTDIQMWLDANPEAKIMVDALPQPVAPPVVGYVPPAYVPPAKVIAPEKEEEEPAPVPTPSPIPAPTLVPVVSISNVFPTSSLVGEPLVIGVNVSPTGGGPMPTGTVKVRAGANYFCAATLDSGGNATCTGGIPSAGLYAVTADYLGDASYLPASSLSWIEFSVGQAATITTLNPPLPSLAGTAATFSATVNVLSPGAGTPYGSVTFTNGSVTTYCTDASAPWECTYTFGTAGSYTVQATYSGDANFIGSFSFITHDVLASADTEFRSPVGPAGTIGACPQTYQADALDINGVSGIEVEYRIGDSVFNATDLTFGLLYGDGTGYWDTIFTIPAQNTDTVYWRFIATDMGGNKTFLGNGSTYTTGYTGAPVNAYSYTGITCP
jgi:hypothetical protein